MRGISETSYVATMAASGCHMTFWLQGEYVLLDKFCSDSRGLQSVQTPAISESLNKGQLSQGSYDSFPLSPFD